MATVSWADFLGAVQVQLTSAVTYAWSHNPILTITYELAEYSGNGHSSTGTFTTTASDLGMLWRRYPSNGNVSRYLVLKSIPDIETSDFSSFILTKTNIDEFSIAPNKVTNDNTQPTLYGWFDSNSTYRNLGTALFSYLVSKYSGRQTYGSGSTGKNSVLKSYSIDSYDGGDIQLYAATQELNLGLGGATDLGTGTGDTSSPFIDTGTGISIMANARKKKRDFLW